MANYSALFGGLEAYMDETNVDVSVNTDAAEQAEEVESTAAEATEVESAAAEATEEDQAAQAVFRRFDEIANMLHVAKTQGVNSTFLALTNAKGELARGLSITLPSCESFDAVGSRNSAESRAVIAGLEGVLSDIWEWIKKVCRKVVDFVKRIFDAVITRCSSLESNIERLKKAIVEKKIRTGEDLKDRKCDWIKNEEDIKKNADKVAEKHKEVMDAYGKLQALTSKASGDNATEADQTAVEKAQDDLKDKNKDFDDALKDVKIETEEKECSKLIRGTVEKKLSDIAKYVAELRYAEHDVKEQTAYAEFLEKQASRYGQMNVDDDRKLTNAAVNNYRHMAGTLSKLSSLTNKELALKTKYCNVVVRCIASYIANSMTD